MADEHTQIGELNRDKAMELVRATASLLELAELELAERSGEARISVLKAMSKRAGALIADVAEIDSALAMVVDGAGEGAENVLGVIRGALASASSPAPEAVPEPPIEPASTAPPTGPVRAEERPTEPVSPEGPVRAEERPTEPVRAEERPTEPVRAEERPRVLIGPQVLVRQGDAAELVPSTSLWRGGSR